MLKNTAKTENRYTVQASGFRVQAAAVTIYSRVGDILIEAHSFLAFPLPVTSNLLICSTRHSGRHLIRT